MNLPAPKYATSSASGSTSKRGGSFESGDQAKFVPPYGARLNYEPTSVDDYGDGGAFPEINRLQYPLNMGKAGTKGRAVVSLEVDGKGGLKYDSIIKNGKRNNTRMSVQSTLVDTKEKDGAPETLAMPDEEEIADTAERTRLALEAKMSGLAGGPGKSTSHHDQVQKKDEKDPQYIRYNVLPNAPGYSEKTAQRVIKMVEAPVDPMEPPKHMIGKHFLAKDRSKSPPAPVLHAPAKTLTKEEQKAWKIPPALSNWKNERGFIIPLDKRVALDGRGGIEATINDKFASLSEALYLSEKKAAEDLRVRNNVRKQMALKEKEDKEEDLRLLAARARASKVESLNHDMSGYATATATVSNPKPRGVSNQPAWMTSGTAAAAAVSSGVSGAGNAEASKDDGDDDDDDDDTVEEAADDRQGTGIGSGDDDDTPPASRSSTPEVSAVVATSGGGEEADSAEQLARVQREKLRAERRKERERELRQENMKGVGGKSKRGDDDRDISEKIALGMHTGSGGGGGAEAMYDARLFNQSSGMDSGFGAEDEYNAYSKPLFNQDGAASSIYRPRQSTEDQFGDVDTQLQQLKDTSKFKPDKGFQGSAEAGGVDVGDGVVDRSSGGARGATARSAPVQFEMAASSAGGATEPAAQADDEAVAKTKRARRS